MCKRKRGWWKVGIAIMGVLLLLILSIWVPVSTTDAYEATSRLAMSGTIAVQTTPTEDATVTALQKEMLTQQVEQLKAQNKPDLLGWLQTNTVLLSTLIVVIGGLIGLFRWAADRRSEREKRAEERFQTAVTGLGDDNPLTRINAAILLRNFLHPGYERFSTQIFELAVAHLRLPRTPGSPTGSDVPLLLTPLGQKLLAVFIEAFPLARNVSAKNPLSLDATGIQLNNAHLEGVDLKQVKMPRAFLRRAKLGGADLSGADLREADLTWADLREANLSDANLSGADLREANLSGAKLINTKLTSTCLARVDLRFADLSFANLKGVYLSDAKLKHAQFFRANLSEAYLCRVDFSGVNLKDAALREANLRETKLRDADLSHARLRDAVLRDADLSRADLWKADLNRTDLWKANLSHANLSSAWLGGAKLSQTNLNGADLSFASFSRAHFSGADRGNTELCEAYLWLLGLSAAELVELSQANPKRIDLSEDDLRWIKRRQADRQWEETCNAHLQWANTSMANIEDARFLKNTYLGGSWGLTKEQLEACEKKGAIRGSDQELWKMQDPSPSVPRDHDMATVLERLTKGKPIPKLPDADQRIPSPPHRSEGFSGPRRTYGGILRIPSSVRYVSGEYTVKYVQRSRYSLLRSLLRSVVPLLLLIPFSMFGPKAFSLPSSLLLYWWIGSGLGVLGLLAVAGMSYMDYVDDVFVLSNKRITHVQNKFKVEYEDIHNVKINVPTILERFLDVGNVIIETTSYPPQITLRAVDHPFVLLDEIIGVKTHKERVDRAERENNEKKNRHVWLETVLTKLEENVEGGSVPDLREKDLLTASSYAQEFGLDVAVWGEAEPSMGLPSDYVVHQNPPAGTRVEKGCRIEVVLSKRPAPVEQTGDDK